MAKSTTTGTAWVLDADRMLGLCGAIDLLGLWCGKNKLGWPSTLEFGVQTRLLGIWCRRNCCNMLCKIQPCLCKCKHGYMSGDQHSCMWKRTFCETDVSRNVTFSYAKLLLYLSRDIFIHISGCQESCLQLSVPRTWATAYAGSIFFRCYYHGITADLS